MLCDYIRDMPDPTPSKTGVVCKDSQKIKCSGVLGEVVNTVNTTCHTTWQHRSYMTLETPTHTDMYHLEATRKSVGIQGSNKQHLI